MPDGCLHCGRVTSILGLLLLTGCGSNLPPAPPLAPVSGKVTVDGAGVIGATVVAVPESGVPANATTSVDGAYSLLTNGKPGALLGKHKIAIIIAGPAEAGALSAAPDGGVGPDINAGDTGAQPKARVTPNPLAKYASHETSGLTLTVPKEGTKQDFDLKSK